MKTNYWTSFLDNRGIWYLFSDSKQKVIALMKPKKHKTPVIDGSKYNHIDTLS